MSCGNSIGCTGSGRRPKNSLAAAANVGRAVVNTPPLWPGSSGAGGGTGTLRSTKLQPTAPSSARTPARSALLTGQRAGLVVPAAPALPGAPPPGSGPIERTKFTTFQMSLSVIVPFIPFISDFGAGAPFL